MHHACTQDNVALVDWLIQRFEVLGSEHYLSQHSNKSKKRFKDEDKMVVEVLTVCVESLFCILFLVMGYCKVMEYSI